MFSLNSGLNAKAVKTELDEILWTKYSKPPTLGGFGHASTADLFVQEGIDSGSVIIAEHMGPGKFESHAEEEEVTQTSPRTANKKTIDVENWKLDLPIPDEFWQDDQHNLVARDVADMARQAKNAQDENAFDLYPGGFATHKTPDASYLWATHTNLNGDSVDNSLTGALTPDTMEVIIRTLYEQRDQRGTLGGHQAAAFLVPPALIKKAVQYSESELEPKTTDNQINYISAVWGGMKIYQSPWVGETYSGVTGANTMYYCVSKEHRITRGIRKPLSTTLVGWAYDPNSMDRHFYKARYREVAYAGTWEGAVGSTGA